MERIEKLLFFLNDSPNDSFLQHALALEYIKEGKDREARFLFEEILEREPSYIGSYYHLAKLLERNGEIAAALHCYRKGMDAAKAVDNSKVYNELQAAWEELSYE
ncbi:tetratricopeptide repeat protein [Agriterribacter sp.]|uniref:tetratricopeptide repeat protein n=1 Tax=Agriterribacter sp. TaxID=2821509 RepID=UPI002C41E344|nr:tetratricopeptide repeat protein [Agriterribacter sp.]HTN09008.1 tetratricopeptide repeat protein [Agriterribacter sp.]